MSPYIDLNTRHLSGSAISLDHRLLSIYGIGNGITCAIVPHSNAPETLPQILSARKDLVKGHLGKDV